jgi:hypothetical protein
VSVSLGGRIGNLAQGRGGIAPFRAIDIQTLREPKRQPADARESDRFAPIHDLRGRGPSPRYRTLAKLQRRCARTIRYSNETELRVTLLGSVDRQFAAQGAIPWYAEIRVFISAIPLAGEAGVARRRPICAA